VRAEAREGQLEQKRCYRPDKPDGVLRTLRFISVVAANCGPAGIKPAKETWGHDTFMCSVDFMPVDLRPLSTRTACEIGPISLFRFRLFEISAHNRICRHPSKKSRFRIARGERCLDSRSVELAMRLKTASLRNTLCRSGYVLKRSSKILHHR